MEVNMSTMDLKAIILVAKRRRPKAQKQASNEKWRGAFFSRPALPLCLFCSKGDNKKTQPNKKKKGGGATPQSFNLCGALCTSQIKTSGFRGPKKTKEKGSRVRIQSIIMGPRVQWAVTHTDINRLGDHFKKIPKK